MSRFLFPFYIFSLLLFITLIACDDNFENYSKDPNHTLSFSTDTLSFEEVLSTIGTSTRQFMVYNKNDQPLLISSVILENSENSGFRINVDGRKGTNVSDIRIESNDSMYVFVEATLPENGEGAPVLVEDRIVFTTNGVQQGVVLEAHGQDVFIWKGVVVNSSTILSNSKPYLIYDSLLVKEGVELTILEGTTFYIHDKATIKVSGNIRAKGSVDKRIVFRGDRMDRMFTDVPYDRIPGQWEGIYFTESSYDNEFDYVSIRNGVYGLYFEQSNPERTKLILRNSVVKNVSDTLISALNCRIEAENCEFSNAGGPLLYLNGGRYRFTQCTAANYMDSFWGSVRPTGKTVVLTNALMDSLGNVDTPLPMLQADFFNTIVYGDRNYSSYVSIEQQARGWEIIPLNYKFHDCLIIASGTNDGDTIANTIFNEDPKFLLMDETQKLYDFHLDSISPARNIANKEIAETLPYDLDGIFRLSDEGPDIGAYEWIPAN